MALSPRKAAAPQISPRPPGTRVCSSSLFPCRARARAPTSWAGCACVRPLLFFLCPRLALSVRAEAPDAPRSLVAGPPAKGAPAKEDPKASTNKEEKWVEVQIKGLTAWVNSYMVAAKNKDISKLENLEKDFCNGVKLNQFVELLSGEKKAFALRRLPAAAVFDALNNREEDALRQRAQDEGSFVDSPFLLLLLIRTCGRFNPFRT